MICDQGSVSILLLLDMSVAFDTPELNILLVRLIIGISSVVFRWLESYLTDHNQIVLKYGVPQGSVLGLVLFTMYLTPLGYVIRHCTVH